MLPERLPNSDRSCESLEARLRALPPLPVPDDLEARLLAAIPPEIPHLARTKRSRRQPKRPGAEIVWAGAAAVLAAVCLLVMLRWAETGSRITAPSLAMIPEKSESTHLVVAPGDSPHITPWLAVRQGLDGEETPTFTWPIEDKPCSTVSIWTLPDLLD